MTALEPRISVVTLGVDDMQRARAFYERLGWRAAASSSDDVTFFNLAGVVLGLYGRKALADDARVAVSAGPSTNASLAHNCESEDRVDASYGICRSCRSEDRETGGKGVLGRLFRVFFGP